jgi:hypothetical protein
MSKEIKFQETVLMNFGPKQRFGYVLDWEVSGVTVTTIAYKIDATDDKDQPYFGDVSSLEDADIFLKQSLKWDGCIDTYFPSSGFHFCDGEDLLQLGELLKYIYNKALELTVSETVDEYIRELDGTPRTFDLPYPYISVTGKANDSGK